MSCEVRWFMPEPPTALTDWFLRRGLVLTESTPSRCDFYLRQHRRSAQGIKLREGNIEVKERIQNLGVHCWGANLRGRAELWRKWSFKLAHTREGAADEALAITRGQQAEHWIAIQKQRLLLLLDIQEEGRVVWTPAPQFLKEGCQVEWTRLQVLDQTWHTIGLEAFSITGRQGYNLWKSLDALSAEWHDTTLSARYSFGYPSFIHRLLLT